MADHSVISTEIRPGNAGSADYRLDSPQSARWGRHGGRHRACCFTAGSRDLPGSGTAAVSPEPRPLDAAMKRRAFEVRTVCASQ